MKRITTISFLFAFIISISFSNTWTGSTNQNASLASNWSGGLPSSSEDIFFSNCTNTSILFNFPSAPTSVGDITFLNNSLSYTINSSDNTFLRTDSIFNYAENSSQIFNINIEVKNDSVIYTEGDLYFNKNIFLQTGNGDLEFSGFSGNGGIFFSQNTQLENITNLTLSSGIYLNLGGADLNFESLTVIGDSILDFANTSKINVKELNILGADTTLTILNWSAADIFFSQFEISQEELPKIIFSDFQGGASWSNGKLTPVPEPSTFLYALFCLSPLFLRRKKR